MLLSHKHKFIFLHVPKTGGQSIHKAIEPFMNVTDEFGAPTNKEKFYHHSKPNDVLKYISKKVWKSYFKFAFIRNPWDRMVSQYFFFKTKDIMVQFNPNWHEEFSANYSCFNDWLLNSPKNNWFDQGCDWLFNGDELEVDFIGRFEHIRRDFQRVCKVIGIEDVELPRVNKTRHNHYSEYYNNETMEFIERNFKKDISMFGYEFKNISII